ncbi:MAG: DsbA family protein [bacterium]
MPSEEFSQLSDLIKNPWFYFMSGLTALLFFIFGIVTTGFMQQNQPTIENFLDTDVPSWLQSVRKNQAKKSLGNPNAAVTLVEYMDVECPFCHRYSKRVFPKIVREYVRTGKIHYKIRHFPLTKTHPNAMKGAIGAECAAEQGKFWTYKTITLNNRKYLSPELIRAMGQIIDVPDVQQYKNCVRNNKYIERVSSDIQDGVQKGVDATPTVLIDGKSITGAQAYSKYKKAIEQALNQQQNTSRE